MLPFERNWRPYLIAASMLLTGWAAFAQNSKAPTPQQVKAIDAYVATAKNDEAAQLLRTTPPMELGVWQYVRTDVDGRQQAPEKEEHCEPGFLSFIFRPYIPSPHKMNTNRGLSFRSEKIGEGLYRLQSAATVEQVGETLAVHTVQMKGNKAFHDQIEFKSRFGVRKASMAGRWLRGCKP